MVRLLTIASCVCLGCDGEPTVDATVTREVALDAAFRSEARWLGGDGAYTIDLGDDRTLWLFGDSFIATSPSLVRTQSTMVRNSVAVMTGRELSTATLSFAWRDGSPPTSFFPEAGDRWFWPSDGARGPGGTLLVWLSEIRASEGGLGFAGAGYRAVRVRDPSGPPASWQLESTSVQPPAFAATANIACSTIDAEYLVALVTDDDDHDGRLVRWPLAAIDTGELADPSWWTGSAWQAQSTLAHAPPVVTEDGATECSLHFDAATGRWLLLYSRGFGATTIAVRTAPALTGPWSDAFDIFTPPESAVDDAFVYAAKAHPMLPGPRGGILVTYADNSFDFGDLFEPGTTLYWPHVAALIVASR